MSLENISRLAKVLSLPITRKIKDGTSIIIDKLQENDLNEAYKVFMRYAAGGDGISKDEYKTVDDFRRRMYHESVSYYAKEAKTGEFVGIFNILPCGMARSTNPITQAGYVILNPDMVNRGCGREIYAIYFFIGAALGFTGITARTAAANVLSYLSLRRVGLEFQGYIADSYEQEKQGWQDDIIFSIDTTVSDVWKRLNEPYSQVIPTLSPSPPNETHFDLMTKNLWIIDNYSGLKTSLPDGRNIQILQDGSGGFAIDEFNPEGVWNKRLLTKSATLVMKDEATKELMGAAIIGPSKLSRSSEPVLLGIYIIVNNKYKLQDVASVLGNECFQIAYHNDFHMCVADLYGINTAGIHLAQSLGYKVQGSVFRSGYFKSKGYIDTLLYYKFCQRNRSTFIKAANL